MGSGVAALLLLPVGLPSGLEGRAQALLALGHGRALAVQVVRGLVHHPPALGHGAVGRLAAALRPFAELLAPQLAGLTTGARRVQKRKHRSGQPTEQEGEQDSRGTRVALVAHGNLLKGSTLPRSLDQT